MAAADSSRKDDNLGNTTAKRVLSYRSDKAVRGEALLVLLLGLLNDVLRLFMRRQ